ncbi:MAG: alpha/beta fold hydrolase [Chitinophagaceae bacterium]|nr:alpha/beta fold hydrolase [Chitinophagaceae bacterium]
MDKFTGLRRAMKLAQKLVVNYFRAKLNIISVLSKRSAAKSAFKLFCTPLRKQRIKTPKIFSKGEQLQFSLHGYTIKGLRWNHPAEKKALIIHGFESSSKNFDRYIGALLKKGYEVLIFDAPAHGLSSGKRITLPLYMESIQKIHELYGPVDAYIGHSFGGLVLSHFLETVPHNGSLKVVFIAPATEMVTSVDTFFRFLHLDDGVRREFDQLILEKSGHYMSHFSMRRTMKNVEAGVLWFHDEDDLLTPIGDALKVRDDGHPNITFRITKGLGHRRIYRDNKIFKETIDFL